MKSDMKSNDTNNENGNKSDNINNNSTKAQEENAENINYDDLFKQLGILDLSINAVYIVIIAVVMNLDFLNHQKGQVLDSINNTNFFKRERDTIEEARVSNRLFLYTTCIFLGINVYSLQQLMSVDGDKRNEIEIRKAKNRVVSSILILIATKITTSILNL